MTNRTRCVNDHPWTQPPSQAFRRAFHVRCLFCCAGNENDARCSPFVPREISVHDEQTHSAVCSHMEIWTLFQRVLRVTGSVGFRRTWRHFSDSVLTDGESRLSADFFTLVVGRRGLGGGSRRVLSQVTRRGAFCRILRPFSGSVQSDVEPCTIHSLRMLTLS